VRAIQSKNDKTLQEVNGLTEGPPPTAVFPESRSPPSPDKYNPAASGYTNSQLAFREAKEPGYVLSVCMLD